MRKQQGASLSLRLPRDLRAKLEEIATREANNVNSVARRFLALGVDRMTREEDKRQRRSAKAA